MSPALVQNQPQLIRSLLRLIAGLFVGLCLLHFFSARPLWLDENFVLKNIQELTPPQIFGRLNYAQGFPRVYLAIIQITTQFFDHQVLVLRAFSLAAMLGAYRVWWLIYREAFGVSWEMALTLFAFSASYAMSYYAAELKPYSMDVLVAGIFVLLLLRQAVWERVLPSSREKFLLINAPLLLLFSYAGFFFVLWPLVNLIVMSRKKPAFWRLAAGYLAVLSAVAFFIYRFDLRFAVREKALLDYWDSYFLCVHSWNCFGETFGEGIRRIATWSFGKGKLFMRWGSFVIPFFLYAFCRHGWLAWFKDRGKISSLATAGAASLALLLILSLFRIFPFTGDRITLFFCPFVFYYFTRALQDLTSYPRSFYFLLGNYLIFLLGCMANSFIIYLGFYRNGH